MENFKISVYLIFSLRDFKQKAQFILTLSQDYHLASRNIHNVCVNFTQKVEQQIFEKILQIRIARDINRWFI